MQDILSPATWRALRAEIDVDPAAPSSVRLAWLRTFAEATRLRVAELVSAGAATVDTVEMCRSVEANVEATLAIMSD